MRPFNKKDNLLGEWRLNANVLVFHFNNLYQVSCFLFEEFQASLQVDIFELKLFNCWVPVELDIC